MSAKTVAMRVALLLVLLCAASAQTTGDSSSDSKTITIDKKIGHQQATLQPYSTYSSGSQQTRNVRKCTKKNSLSVKRKRRTGRYRKLSKQSTTTNVPDLIHLDLPWTKRHLCKPKSRRSAHHYPRSTASIKLNDERPTTNPYIPKAEARTGSDAKLIETRNVKNYKVRSPNSNSDVLQNYLNKAANPQEPLDKQTVQDITNNAVGCTLDSIARNMNNKLGSGQLKAENVTVTTSEKEITTDLINEYLKIIAPTNEQAQAKQMQTSESLKSVMEEFQKSLADCVLMQKARASMEKSGVIGKIETQNQSVQTAQKPVTQQQQQQQQQQVTSGGVQNSQSGAGIWQNSQVANMVGQPLQSGAQFVQKSLDINMDHLPSGSYKQNLQFFQPQQQQQQQQQQQNLYYQTISQTANNAKLNYDGYNSDTFSNSYPNLLEFAQSLMQNSAQINNPSSASSVSWSYSSQPSAPISSSYIQTIPISYTLPAGYGGQQLTLQDLSNLVNNQGPSKRSALDDIWKSANNFAGSIVDTSTKTGPITSDRVLGSIGSIWNSASNLAQSVGAASPQYPVKARSPTSPQMVGMTHTVLPASLFRPGMNLAQEITRIATDPTPITANKVFDATGSLFKAGENLYNSYGNQNVLPAFQPAIQPTIQPAIQPSPVPQPIAPLFQAGTDLAQEITKVATDQGPITPEKVLDATSNIFKAGENLYNANNNNDDNTAASSTSEIVGAQLRALSGLLGRQATSAQGSLGDALQQAGANASRGSSLPSFGIGPYYAGGYFPRNSQSAAGSIYNSAAQLASDIIDATPTNSGQAGPNVIPLGVVSKSTLQMVGNILNAANNLEGAHPRFYKKK